MEMKHHRDQAAIVTYQRSRRVFFTFFIYLVVILLVSVVSLVSLVSFSRFGFKYVPRRTFR